MSPFWFPESRKEKRYEHQCSCLSALVNTRTGEGAPYTGLKPAGSADPAVMLADEAVETGSPEKMVKVLTEAVENGIRHRYADAVGKKKQSAGSVEAGREFVEAYVVYVHFVEGLHQQLKATTHHHEGGTGTGGEGH